MCAFHEAVNHSNTSNRTPHLHVCRFQLLQVLCVRERRRPRDEGHGRKPPLKPLLWVTVWRVVHGFQPGFLQRTDELQGRDVCVCVCVCV